MQDVDRMQRIVHDARFRQFDLEQGWRDAGHPYRRCEPVDDVLPAKLQCRHVDRNRNVVDALRPPRLQHAGGLLDREAADRFDAAGFFGNRDEDAWCDPVAFILGPADQRFEAGDVARPCIHLGLIVHDEFAGADGALQGDAQGEFAAGRFLHLRGEKRIAAAAFLLGVGHRNIGVAQQDLGNLSVVRKNGYPDAGKDMQFAALDAAGGGHGGNDLFGDHCCVLKLMQSDQHHHEFVPDHARNRVAVAHAGNQALGHVL